ncbi:hypothetical protein [Niabella soli]|nr:hypothetical protein [Niabella soli]
MRPAIKNCLTIMDESLISALPVKFTADAISYLSGVSDLFDIRDWVWHIEIVNGEQYCVVTDKLQQQLLKKEPVRD